MAECLVSRWLNKTKSILLKGLESFIWALWQLSKYFIKEIIMVFYFKERKQIKVWN